MIIYYGRKGTFVLDNKSLVILFFYNKNKSNKKGDNIKKRLDEHLK